ncbi:MAG: AAA domain-containing protein [Bacteroidota bacterium]
MSASKESILKQIELLRLEKEEDLEQYQRKVLNTSPKERRREGVTWYPVKVDNMFISTGDRVSVDLIKTNDFDQKHSFQVGSLVSLFGGYGKDTEAVTGVVSYLKGKSMRIALNTSEFPIWVNHEKTGVNLMFDENTYREMEMALKDVVIAENGRLAELRKVFYGEKDLAFGKGYRFDLPYLNVKQNEALNKAIQSEDIAIIHGPPGTGKTTTIVNAIKAVVQDEKQVLVCAQSNAAVDLLVEKLDKLDINVLRIGHPARLTPEVIENSLDVKISKHDSFKELKEVRKRSEEMKRLGHQYKREFGKQERVQRGMLLKEARILKQDADRIESYITDALLDNTEVIACTLVGSRHYLLKERRFKTVFIDEASQALEGACWIPILKADRVIMAGDHQQLPPTIKSYDAAKKGLSKTLFEKGIQNLGSSVMLETQYRMNPEIMNFSSSYFYDNKLKTASEVMEREDLFSYERPFEFIDTAGAGFDEAIKKETLSTYNEEEARFLIDHLAISKYENKSIAIIAPYKAQTETIMELLSKDERLDDEIREKISINSVDAFQGQERDIVYISLTRSNDKNEIGFLKEYRRMNVAMTRAKSKLVMIGDSATLGSDNFFNQIIEHVQEIGGYRSVFEYAH